MPIRINALQRRRDAILERRRVPVANHMTAARALQLADEIAFHVAWERRRRRFGVMRDFDQVQQARERNAQRHAAHHPLAPAVSIIADG